MLELPAVLSPQAVVATAVTLAEALRRPLDRVPAQAVRGAKPRGGSSKSRERRTRSGRSDAVKLAVLALLLGGFLLFPDQVMSTYMSVVEAVISPMADDLVQDMQENMAPTPAP